MDAERTRAIARELAELRIWLDLALASGDHGPLHTQLEEDYKAARRACPAITDAIIRAEIGVIQADAGRNSTPPSTPPQRGPFLVYLLLGERGG